MNETQKIYHELEMMQELDLIKGDITEMTTQALQELEDTTGSEPTTKELENHMVLPTVAPED